MVMSGIKMDNIISGLKMLRFRPRRTEATSVKQVGIYLKQSLLPPPPHTNTKKEEKKRKKTKEKRNIH